jgi:hypothetical protein
MVKVIFTDRQGLQRVERGQFIINHARFGRQINPSFWRKAIEPGDELSMAMVLADRHGKEGFCPWENCRACTQHIELTFDGKIWLVFAILFSNNFRQINITYLFSDNGDNR